MDTLQNKFIEDVEAYAGDCGIRPSLVTRRAVDDGGLLDRMKQGGSCTFAQAAKVRAFMAENPPAQIPPSETATEEVAA